MFIFGEADICAIRLYAGGTKKWEGGETAVYLTGPCRMIES